MKPIIILLISILLIGCTRTEYINNTIIINNTITINNTKYINVTVKEPCNLTCVSKERELELIRRLKFLENQQDKRIMNETECVPHNATEEQLKDCNDKINRYLDDIYDLEDELDDCETELCDINKSWC